VVLRYKGGRFTSVGGTRLIAVAEQARFEDLFDWQLKAEKAPPWRRQYAFSEAYGRAWKIDFAWPELLLAVEIQGGIWRKGGGAHSHPSNILRNMKKCNALTALRWRLLQFSTDEVQSGSALQYTMTVLRGKVPNPL
jgi:hypothetical protein